MALLAGLAIELDCLPGALFMAGEQRANLTIAAPERTLLAKPPQAKTGLVATRAHRFSAKNCLPRVPKRVFLTSRL